MVEIASGLVVMFKLLYKWLSNQLLHWLLYFVLFYLKGFPVDVFAEIYPSVLPGLNETESIMDKRQLCIRAINAIYSIVDTIHTKTLRFKNHDTIEDTRCKLIAIYNPLRCFSHLYLPGYEVSNSHETTSFNMN